MGWPGLFVVLFAALFPVLFSDSFLVLAGFTAFGRLLALAALEAAPDSLPSAATEVAVPAAAFFFVLINHSLPGGSISMFANNYGNTSAVFVVSRFYSRQGASSFLRLRLHHCIPAGTRGIRYVEIDPSIRLNQEQVA
jgi:hypothetical protein